MEVDKNKQGNKTHQQQRDIIEKRVNTANAGPDFDADTDLHRSDAAKGAFERGANLNMRTAEVSLYEDPSIVRGQSQGKKAH